MLCLQRCLTLRLLYVSASVLVASQGAVEQVQVGRYDRHRFATQVLKEGNTTLFVFRLRSLEAPAALIFLKGSKHLPVFDGADA